MEAGRSTRRTSARRLGRLARTLLRRHPTDADLITAVDRLASRRFEPPPATTLPPGSPRAVWTALSGRSLGERRALATSVVDLPDPAEDRLQAARVLELLLSIPDETGRAERLLERLAPHADPSDLALWRFRLAAAAMSEAEREDPAAWEGLLDSVREVERAEPLKTALRLAASGWLETREEHGVGWLTPCLGGRRILNREVALRRRPALREALAPALGWLREAARLEDERPSEGLEARLDEVDRLDDAGRLEEASRALSEAAERSGERPDLAAALASRADALLDPHLASRALALVPLEGAPDPEALRAVADRPVEAPPVAPPAPPPHGWSRALVRLADTEPSTADPTELGLLEAAGAVGRAALGWMARADDGALLQAWRLREALSAGDRATLLARLKDRVPDDEQSLAGDAHLSHLARALRATLDPGAERTLLEVRLRAADAGGVPLAETPSARADPDDPHSAANRLAAAADLLTSERPEAAGAIVSALLRKLEEPETLPHLMRLTVALLRMDPPPEGVVAASERAILTGGDVGEALLGRLADEPVAAYPLHAGLQRAASDHRRSDALRVRLLVAWLGIWRATKTPPDPAALTALMGADPALVPLAAARLAGALDPVSTAADFLAAYPPGTTAPTAWSRALLELTLARRL